MRLLKKIKTVSLILLILLSSTTLYEIKAVGTDDSKIDKRSVSDHAFKGVSPVGTTIDLFDYWITPGQFDVDNGWIESYAEQGINKGKVFKFLQSSNTGDRFGYLNKGDGTSTPKQGIVKNRLNSDGYPSLNKNFNGGTGGITRDESLNYLFDQSSFFGKEAFSNAKGLLQIDNEGYYYYNSTKDYAQFNKSTKDFSLYHEQAVIPTKGQFFPFNTGNQMFREENGNLVNNIDPIRDYFDPVLNHYFGLSMTTTFVQKDGGTNHGKPVTYSFSGDDDVWVFIDGVLVGDVGGMHAATSLDIDFQSGEVRVHGNIGTTTEMKTTIKDAFYAAGITDSSRFSGNTFADESFHTLKFFYMERGNAASNLALRYNLVLEPENKITKTDENGNPLAGAEFTLYSANSSYTALTEVFRGSSDEDGIIPLNTLTIDKLKSISNYFVLKETKTPAGYRTSADVQLTFDGSGDKQVLKVNNQWNSGALASNHLIASISTKDMTCINHSNFPLKDPNTGDLSQGFIFGVVLKNVNGDWRPVYGSNEQGWTIADNSQFDSIKAAYESNPYIFKPDRNGIYQQRITLPDDVKKYDIYSNSNPQYLLKYYYSTQAEVTEATLYELDKNKGFSYKFASDIQLSNIKNTFYLQKVDSEKKPLSNAEFAVYKSTDVLITSDGKKKLLDGAVPYARDITADRSTAKGDAYNLQGAASFTIPKGTFYVVESKAPDGYVRNEELIEIRSDDTGVYGNAGLEEDGISVLDGVGFLRPNQKGFAASVGIDQSLHDLFVTLQNRSTDSDAWASTKWTHLQYGSKDAIVDYGPHDDTFPQLLETKAGWGRLQIQQCLDHDAGTGIIKQDLGAQELSSLYSKMTVIQVENAEKTNLLLKKIVKGTDEDKKKSFTFRFSLETPAASPIQDTFTTRLYRDGVDTGITSTIRTNEDIILKNNESLKIVGLPAGAEYTIKEIAIANVDHCTVKVKINDEEEKETAEASGVLTTSDTSITYTNEYEVKGDFIFTKTNHEDVSLAGASFALYKNLCGNTDGHEDTLLKLDTQGNMQKDDPNYDHWEQVGVFTSDSLGKVEFKDLGSLSEYRLIEYKAPQGYVLPQGQWKLHYNEQDKSFEISGSIKNPPAFKMDGSNYYVANYKPANIPFSGGIGTIFNVGVGGVLMVIGAYGLYWKCRKQRIKK